jgi:hypothetical protein
MIFIETVTASESIPFPNMALRIRNARDFATETRRHRDIAPSQARRHKDTKGAQSRRTEKPQIDRISVDVTQLYSHLHGYREIDILIERSRE